MRNVESTRYHHVKVAIITIIIIVTITAAAAAAPYPSIRNLYPSSVQDPTTHSLWGYRHLLMHDHAAICNKSAG
jgi:hypothetical protein